MNMEKNKVNHIVLEACVETLEQALLAEQNGADRIELCDDLSVGGITPNVELLEKTTSVLKIPIMAMIRPRGGDFVYSEKELLEMEASIRFCKKLGVAGVVFGCLTPDGEVDEAATRRLAAVASPLLVTFHKAIDETPNPVASAKLLAEMGGIQRILTSGGAATAWDGLVVLQKMIAETAGRLTILTAGKVTKENLPDLHQKLGAAEYHGKRIVF